MTKTSLAASAICIGMAFPVHADPSVGVGLSFSFGGGTTESGIGVRVFSDDKSDEFAASLGLDYMFQSQRVRPTAGAAYLGSDAYVGVDIGYDFNTGALDYGMSAGGLSSTTDADPLILAE